MAEQMLHASIPSFTFFFMLALAAVIATLGLHENNAPVIIGAMIIAPLMSPIMGLSYGLVSFEIRMIRWSILAVIAGAIVVVVISYIITVLLGLRIVHTEILGRTFPSLLDLGVAVAAGAAAAFSYTRRSILNSLAGVAIAVALVPPLSVVGIGLAFGRSAVSETALSLSVLGLGEGGQDIAVGSFVLFLTNLIGIIAVASIVFFSQRYGTWKKTLLAVLLCAGLSAFVFQPLYQAFHRLYVKSQAVQLLAEIPIRRPDMFTAHAKVSSVRIAYRNGLTHVHIEVVAPTERAKHLQRTADLLSQELSTAIREPVVVVLDFLGVDVGRTQSQAPESSTSGAQPDREASE
jgi:uncharacterized hydrophobic protein (TIGR00271 family)